MLFIILPFPSATNQLVAVTGCLFLASATDAKINKQAIKTIRILLTLLESKFIV
jgi:hypothetical protein